MYSTRYPLLDIIKKNLNLFFKFYLIIKYIFIKLFKYYNINKIICKIFKKISLN